MPFWLCTSLPWPSVVSLSSSRRLPWGSTWALEAWLWCLNSALFWKVFLSYKPVCINYCTSGVGIATMTVVFFLDIYYCVIIGWTFFYLFATFSSLPDLPWDTCGKPSQLLQRSSWYFSVGWWNTEECFRPTDNMTANDIRLANYSWHNVTKNGVTKLLRKTTTPVEEFWE